MIEYPFSKKGIQSISKLRDDFGGIYCIEHVESKRIYIGSSKNIARRLYGHLNKLNKNKHGNFKLQIDFLKNSVKFKCYILSTTPDEYLEKLEQWYLDNVVNFDKDYNICKLANGGPKSVNEKTTAYYKSKIKLFLTLNMSPYEFCRKHSISCKTEFIKRFKKYCIDNDLIYSDYKQVNRINREMNYLIKEYEKVKTVYTISEYERMLNYPRDYFQKYYRKYLKTNKFTYDRKSYSKRKYEKWVKEFLESNLNKTQFIKKNKVGCSKTFNKYLNVYLLTLNKMK